MRERERERRTDRQRGRVSEFWTHILIIRPLSRGVVLGPFGRFSCMKYGKRLSKREKRGGGGGSFDIFDPILELGFPLVA